MDDLNLLDDEYGPDSDRFGPLVRGWVERRIQMSRLLEDSTGPLTDVQYWILKTHLDNGDEAEAKKFIQDWNATRDRKTPEADISKWLPGAHFYALDRKFATLDEATGYLKERGFRFSGNVRERFAYRESGG